MYASFRVLTYYTHWLQMFSVGVVLTYQHLKKYIHENIVERISSVSIDTICSIPSLIYSTLPITAIDVECFSKDFYFMHTPFIFQIEPQKHL